MIASQFVEEILLGRNRNGNQFSCCLGSSKDRNRDQEDDCCGLHVTCEAFSLSNLGSG
jgi:hypothetical protein